jgi:hypothetical protein
VARSRFFPPDNVTALEWFFLLSRYSADEAQERREWFCGILKQLVRKGRDPRAIHRALMDGLELSEAHKSQQMTSPRIAARKRAIVRAEKDVVQALASLRRLLPDAVQISDDDLLANRELLLQPVSLPAARKRGRPSQHWKPQTDDALRQAGVGPSDRRALMAALGLVADE